MICKPRWCLVPNLFKAQKGFSLIELVIATCLGLILVAALLYHYQLLIQVQYEQQQYYTLLERARLFQLRMKQQLEQSGVMPFGDLLSYQLHNSSFDNRKFIQASSANISVIPEHLVDTDPYIPDFVKRRRKQGTDVFWLRSFSPDQKEGNTLKGEKICREALHLRLVPQDTTQTDCLWFYSKWLFVGFNNRTQEIGIPLSSLYLANELQPRHTQELVEGLQDWKIQVLVLENQQWHWYPCAQVKNWEDARLVAIKAQFFAPLPNAHSPWQDWEYRFQLLQNF